MGKKKQKNDSWEIVKYSGDIALYALCKCGFRYACSHNTRNEDGSWSLKQEIGMLYPYCPMCGAKKTYFSDEVRKIDGFPQEYD